MPEQMVLLTDAQLRAIVASAARQGVQDGVKEYVKQRQEEKVKNKRTALHSSKVLLENYQRFKAYLDRAVQTAQDIDAADLDASGEKIMTVFGLSKEEKLNSVKRSVGFMTLVMSHVDRMLEVFKETCRSSSSVTERREWEVIERMYLREQRMTCNQIAEEFHLDPRVIRQDAQNAREDLRILLFGIEAIVEGYYEDDDEDV